MDDKVNKLKKAVRYAGFVNALLILYFLVQIFANSGKTMNNRLWFDLASIFFIVLSTIFVYVCVRICINIEGETLAKRCLVLNIVFVSILIMYLIAAVKMNEFGPGSLFLLYFLMIEMYGFFWTFYDTNENRGKHLLLFVIRMFIPIMVGTIPFIIR